jgi:hypothetical protein
LKGYILKNGICVGAAATFVGSTDKCFCEFLEIDPLLSFIIVTIFKFKMCGNARSSAPVFLVYRLKVAFIIALCGRKKKVKSKDHHSTGNEVLYRPYGP